MESTQKVLTIEPGAWRPEVAAVLQPAVPRIDVESIGDQVTAGRAMLFEVMDGERLIGAYVLRIDGEDGVIVAVAAVEGWQGGDLIPLILPHLESQFIGVKAIRFHTARPGLVRRMLAAGYEPQEFVMRKDLKGEERGV